MKLYELTSSYAQVLDMIEEGADREAMQDTLDSIEDAIEEKVDRMGMVLKTLEANQKALKEEEKRLADRRKHYESESRHLKQYLQHQLESIGKKKVKGTIFTAGIQKNPPSVDVINEDILPKEFFIEQEPKLDKKKLLAYLKEGNEIKGAEIMQSEGVRIR
ncbi:virus Gp157 [Alteribacillus persepolensis]|uniref:Virus Gp157 n=1 Tax=Alteribacillus persepolensis TaxID=568899 RepID=A0A1G8I6C3_9BACI|nr:siphovirus Gp157 family protein [Alteribacillus persepolensis]SDI14384.1 virus Gp157 [Alteribacillus persepolensis]